MMYVEGADSLRQRDSNDEERGRGQGEGLEKREVL